MHTKTFIHQLHTILNDPSLSEWIRWSEEQEGVFVLKPFDKWFSALVLKRYFKHGNVSSFVRQLHMYGFHKMSNFSSDGVSASVGSSTSNAQRGSSPQPRDKTATIWYFTHPLGIFTKDASAATLNRIPRKSTGVGRDGKRKNVLSTVCVNYISQNEPTRDVPSPLNGRSSEDLSINEFNNSFIGSRQHYNSLPAPQVHVRDPLWNKSRTISLPEITPRPLPTAITSASDTGPPLVQSHSQIPSQCLYNTPPSSASRQYDVRLNVHFLQRTLANVAEILPLILRPSLSHQDSQQILSILQTLKQNFFSSDSRSYDHPGYFNPTSTSSNFEEARNWCNE